MLRVGVLMPRSTLYPAIGLDILNGLKTSLQYLGIKDAISFFTENIGFGTNEAEVYAKTEKLILQEDAAVVIACVDARMTELLQPLFTASNKILVVVNFGANLPDSWQTAPTTVIHSLNFAMHTRLTGILAAQQEHKKTINAISYYDGGYTSCYCMLNANQQSGGEPVFNHVTSFKEALFTLAPLEEFVQANTDVKSMLCLFAGDLATLFYRQIAALQQQFDLQLYVSPMMMDESLRDTLGAEFTIQQVKGYIPWLSSFSNEYNQVFCDTYTKTNGKAANLFSLLGWDTGLLLQPILQQQQSGMGNAAQIVQTLIGQSYNSPRGWLKIDPANHYTYGPAYLAHCSNQFELRVEKELENMEAVWADFTKEELPPGEMSSWRNTYLCI
jgi:branched-chain amino acid transport system substrate-binding protein